MPKRGKKYKKVAEKKEVKVYNLTEAIQKVKKNSYSTFVGTAELHAALKLTKDLEPKSIKGAVALPHGESKSVKIAAFTTPADEKKAKDAGADFVGTENIMKEVKSGKINFDIAIATPEVMPQIAQLGKELGPKGLMPNPKTGTVTTDIEKTIKEYKKGKANFSADEKGVIHMAVGKLDLEDEKIAENVKEALQAIAGAVSGKEIPQVIKKTHLAPTMGISVEFEFMF
jgi:large subunit ribosomal protein L1